MKQKILKLLKNLEWSGQTNNCDKSCPCCGANNYCLHCLDYNKNVCHENNCELYNIIKELEKDNVVI